MRATESKLRKILYRVAMRLLQLTYRVGGRRLSRVDHPPMVRALLRKPCVNEHGHPGLVSDFQFQGLSGQWAFVGTSLLTGRPWASMTPIPMGRAQLDAVRRAAILRAYVEPPGDWHTRVSAAAAALIGRERERDPDAAFADPMMRELELALLRTVPR